MTSITAKRFTLSLLKLVSVVGYIYVLFWITNLLIELYTPINPFSWTVNAHLFEPVALFFTFVVILLVLRRISLALLVLTVFYVMFMLINAEMVKNLGLIFSPIDIKHSIQLLFAKEFLFSYWKSLLGMGIIFVGLVFIIIKTKPNQFIKKIQLPAWLLLIPLILMIGYYRFPVTQYLRHNFNFEGQAIPQIFAEYNGFLFNFYYQGLKKHSIEMPENYSEQQVNSVFNEFNTGTKQQQDRINPHVIIFFIEAFADPNQMGIKTNQEAIPNFRKYAQQSLSGLVTSPEFGGRSANPEFELLTGLSMRYVPAKTIPYIDFINQPYPSLAREFKANGYRTNALHVATLAFFNYRRVYDYLGFDHIDTLHDRTGVEMDPIGRFPSENALVDEIIKITDQSEQPQFIFSFPNSTHGLWDYDAYLDADLNVLGEYLGDGKKHLKTYINAIHQADKAIGKLISHYEQSNIPAVVMVLGDHQPSLPEFRQEVAMNWLNSHHPKLNFSSRKQLERAILNKALKTDYDFFQSNHQVPYLIWSNHQTGISKQNTSMNFLPTLLLSYAQMEKSPLYNLMSQLLHEVKEISIKTPLPDAQLPQIKAYELLQYDIMNGENFYMEKIDK